MMSTQPCPDKTEAERATFEAWALKSGWKAEIIAKRDGDGYAEPYLTDYWGCWKDARRSMPAAVAEELPPLGDNETATWAEKHGAQVAWANDPDMHHLIKFTPPELRNAVAADRQARASVPVSVDSWISVKDRLPEPWDGKRFSKSVLTVDMDSRYPHVRMSELNFEEDQGKVIPTVWSGSDPTHWQPAPALPGSVAPSVPAAGAVQQPVAAGEAFPELPEPQHELQAAAKTDAFTAEQMFDYGRQCAQLARNTITIDGRTYTAAEIKQRITDLNAEAQAVWDQHEQGAQRLQAVEDQISRQSQGAGLLREARAALETWKDVAPAVSLCADIDRYFGAAPAPGNTAQTAPHALDDDKKGGAA